MAYATSNPPSELTTRIGGAGAIWSYRSTDTLDLVIAAGYFSNGVDLGMKLGDVVLVYVTGTTTPVVMTSVSGLGASSATVSRADGSIFVSSAIPNGRAASALDGVSTSGTKTITSATIAFTQADVGALVVITSNAITPAAGLQDTTFGVIASVESATSATLVANSQKTISGGTILVGSDNAAAINAATTAAAVKGQTVVLPAGIMMLSAHVTIPEGVLLQGQGRYYPTDTHSPPLLGSCLILAGTDAFGAVLVGLQTSSSLNGLAAMDGVNVDGCNINNFAVTQQGYCSKVTNCWIGHGLSCALNMTAIGGSVQNNFIFETLDMGSGVLVTGTDSFIMGNLIRGYGAGSISALGAAVKCLNTGGVFISGNHFFQNVHSSAAVGSGVIIESSAGVNSRDFTVVGNWFDGCYGSQIRLLCFGASASIYNTSITANIFQQNAGNTVPNSAFPDATYPVIEFNADTGGSGAWGTTVVGNTGNIKVLSGTSAWTAIVTNLGGGTVAQFTMIGNTFRDCNDTSQIAADGGNYGNTVVNKVGTLYMSNNGGRSTQTGNGATLIFNIAHGLPRTPVKWSVTPRVALAAPAFIVTADSTNLIVTYATAPPAVASNVDLQWAANL